MMSLSSAPFSAATATRAAAVASTTRGAGHPASIIDSSAVPRVTASCSVVSSSPHRRTHCRQAFCRETLCCNFLRWLPIPEVLHRMRWVVRRKVVLVVHRGKPWGNVQHSDLHGAVPNLSRPGWVLRREARLSRIVGASAAPCERVAIALDHSAASDTDVCGFTSSVAFFRRRTRLRATFGFLVPPGWSCSMVSRFRQAFAS